MVKISSYGALIIHYTYDPSPLDTSRLGGLPYVGSAP